MDDFLLTGKYPADGEVVDKDGNPTGEFARGFWNDEEIPETMPNVGRYRRQKPPADWGPERRRREYLARLAVGVDDYDPNQPRDRRGRWTRTGAGGGLTDDQLKEIGRGPYWEPGEIQDRWLDSEEGHTEAMRLGHAMDSVNLDEKAKIIWNGDELSEADIQSNPALAAVSEEWERLTTKYPQAFPSKIIFKETPGSFNGWVNVPRHVVAYQYHTAIHFNINFEEQFQRFKRKYDAEFANGIARKLNQFDISKYTRWGEEVGIDFPALIEEFPEWGRISRFTVNPPEAPTIQNFVRHILIHEFAHTLHLGSGEKRYNEIQPLAENLRYSQRDQFISDYAKMNDAEAWAEGFTLYETHPVMAEKILPPELIGYLKKLHG